MLGQSHGPGQDAAASEDTPDHRDRGGHETRRVNLAHLVPHATRHTPAKFSVLVRKREGAGANLVGEFVVELDAFRRLAHRDLVACPPTIHQ